MRRVQHYPREAELRAPRKCAQADGRAPLEERIALVRRALRQWCDERRNRAGNCMANGPPGALWR